MDNEANKNIYAHIVAKAWSDDAFKNQFLANPTQTALDFGMKLLPNTVVVVVQGSGAHAFKADTHASPPKLTVLLPPRPDDLINDAILKISNDFISSKGCTTDP